MRRELITVFFSTFWRKLHVGSSFCSLSEETHNDEKYMTHFPSFFFRLPIFEARGFASHIEVSFSF